MILASAMTCYTKAVQGRFVRELIKRECFTPDRAITLRECGFFCHPTIRRELTAGGALSKITVRVSADVTEEVSSDKMENRREAAPIDLLTARFYIPEDAKYRAELRYRRKGSRGADLILVFVLCVVFTVLLFRGAPILLSFADWLISIFSW